MAVLTWMASPRQPDSIGPWVLRCDASSLPADAGVVDGLARLTLVGRRHGCELRLCGATPELRRLIVFMGLEDVLAAQGDDLSPGGAASQTA